MSCLGNTIWFMFGGAITGCSWIFAGICWSITVIGIPVGKQCFKIAHLCFFPFGKQISYGSSTGSFLLNVCWIVYTGWALAIEATLIGILLCLTIIGIPFGKQFFKIAHLALTPFGAEIS